jgi:hypothetical protein
MEWARLALAARGKKLSAWAREQLLRASGLRSEPSEPLK